MSTLTKDEAVLEQSTHDLKQNVERITAEMVDARHDLTLATLEQSREQQKSSKVDSGDEEPERSGLDMDSQQLILCRKLLSMSHEAQRQATSATFIIDALKSQLRAEKTLRKSADDRCSLLQKEVAQLRNQIIGSVGNNAPVSNDSFNRHGGSVSTMDPASFTPTQSLETGSQSHISIRSNSPPLSLPSQRMSHIGSERPPHVFDSPLYTPARSNFNGQATPQKESPLHSAMMRHDHSPIWSSSTSRIASAPSPSITTERKVHDEPSIESSLIMI